MTASTHSSVDQQRRDLPEHGTRPHTPRPQPDHQKLNVLNSLLGMERHGRPFWKTGDGPFPALLAARALRGSLWAAGRARCVGTLCSLLDPWVPARWGQTGASSGRSEPKEEGERGLIYRERLKPPHTPGLSSAGDESGRDTLGAPRTSERCQHQRGGISTV